MRLTHLYVLTAEVRTDEHGTDADNLRKTLENWPEGKAKPKVLYTVPVRALNMYAPAEHPTDTDGIPAVW